MKHVHILELGGVWRNGQNAYFYIRVTNLSQINQPIQKVLKNIRLKRNDRIMNIEHGTLTPLIFASNGTEC